jgi:hypothetical protein
MITIITNKVNAYKVVIADLLGQEETYRKGALKKVIPILEQRIWEFENVFADIIAEELASKKRHPSNQKRKPKAE